MMQEAVKLLKAELEAFVALLFFAAREMALVAALAGVMQYAVGSGGLLEFVKGMLILKAVILPLQVWRWLNQDFYETLWSLLEKSAYMEKRLMKSEMHAGDICRQISQDMEAYEDYFGNRLWISRRLREHYEAWMKASGGLGGSSMTKRLANLWSMVCTEVLLRNCRDIVGKRWSCHEGGKAMAPERQKQHMKILKNLTMEFCSFWSPLDKEGWGFVEALEPEHYMETCLKSQLLERKIELQDYAEKVGDVVKETLFVGMPELVKSFMEKSQSSGDKKVK